MRRMGSADPTSLDAIQSEAERMTRMVGDLLLLAQAESGNLPLAKVSVELDTVMLEVYQQARVLAGGKVDVTISDVDQLIVLGDRDRLKQLTLNLVGNALQYTPEGGRVTLGLCRVDDWARLSVSDTGPGIPREELPRIFERFYRVDKSRRRTYSGGAGPRLLLSGAGLGLSIAHYIARAHHGRLEVASEVGQGSTFSVWLPLMSQVDAAATRPTPACPSGTPSRCPSGTPSRCPSGTPSRCPSGTPSRCPSGTPSRCPSGRAVRPLAATVAPRSPAPLLPAPLLPAPLCRAHGASPSRAAACWHRLSPPAASHSCRRSLAPAPELAAW
ncbi:MAG: hypothetical protein HY784_09655 [Chloroflexi bacterium]|nr:hypothetical protein [Chloroflexota bacterium]